MVWDQIGRDVNAHIAEGDTLHHLHQYLQDAWNLVTLGSTMRLIRSMCRHCDAVVASNGGSTQYWLTTESDEQWNWLTVMLLSTSIQWFTGMTFPSTSIIMILFLNEIGHRTFVNHFHFDLSIMEVWVTHSCLWGGNKNVWHGSSMPYTLCFC